ncbi:MAG TPA: glycosyl hydrolase [Gaiellales bacterium]
MRVALRAGTALVALLALTAPADAACIKLGIYQDNVAKTLVPLSKAVGPGIKTVSVYVTAGTGLDPRLVTLANSQKLTVLVSWMPDKGKDGPAGKAYSLSNISKGKLDAGLRALGVQLRSLKKSAIVRPMPEPNTPWYAWSGTASGNSAAEYVKAWKHVRGVLRKADPKVRLLWAPYARSVPDTPQNTIASYFPGPKQVDLVGASAANFGTSHGLAWSSPSDLFSTAYATIEGLDKKTPFWIAETGSTATGGDQRGWIQSLGALKKTMPQLTGVVWFDVKDPSGDFRLRATPAATAAFKGLLKGACK